MYRWRIRLLHGTGIPEMVTVEVPARGADYTLQRLGGVGHPIHLSLVDAHLSGEVRLPSRWGLGRDSQAVAANLLGPSIWLYDAGVAAATLEDVELFPNQPDGHARYRMRGGGVARRVWATTRAGVADTDWDEVAVTLPGTPGDRRESGCITIVVRDATSGHPEIDAAPAIRGGGARMAEEDCWETIEARLGVKIEERRKEPFAIRVIGRARAASLLVGWSLVLPRNQVLFAAWLSSDGRLEVRPAIRKRSK
jgi:hypothetical protein